MKILYVNSFYAPDIGGGAEITLASIVEGVASRGHDVLVFCTGVEDALEADVVGRARVFRAKIRNIFWPFRHREASRLRRAIWHAIDRDNSKMGDLLHKVIMKEKPDLICCHNLAGISKSAWSVAKSNNIPVIQVLHDLYLACPATTMSKAGRACSQQCGECRIYRYGFSEQSSSIDAVVGVSRFITERFRALGYFRNARIAVINNARSIADSGRVSLAHQRPLVFGYIGSLTPAKGLEWLLDQFRRVDGGAKLLIAGRGDAAYEDRLREAALGLNVDFLGHVKAKDFFTDIDVCVVPSIWPDTFPGVAFEACAYHVPVIASRIGGLPEIVSDQVNGLLVDPDVPSGLGDAMLKFCEDPDLLERLSAKARESVSRLLDMDRLIDEYIDLYSEVVRARWGGAPQANERASEVAGERNE